MHRFNNNIALQGMLALLAFALLLVVAAKALQPQSRTSLETTAAGIQQTSASLDAVSSSPDVRQNGKTQVATVFHGTIVKNGSDFVLRDQTGTVYRLDSPQRASLFVGKSVELTGQIEKDARLIQVQRIDMVTKIAA